MLFLASRPQPYHFSTLLIIIIVSTIIALIILSASIFIYMKHKRWRHRQPKYPKSICYPDEHSKQNIIYRLLKYFKCPGKISGNSDESLPDDPARNSLIEDYSTSTTGFGK